MNIENIDKTTGFVPGEIYRQDIKNSSTFLFWYYDADGIGVVKRQKVFPEDHSFIYIKSKSYRYNGLNIENNFKLYFYNTDTCQTVYLLFFQDTLPNLMKKWFVVA